MEALTTFIMASVLLALSPGPDNIFVLTQSALFGKKGAANHFWIMHWINGSYLCGRIRPGRPISKYPKFNSTSVTGGAQSSNGGAV